MKLSAVVVLALPALAGAFSPSVSINRPAFSTKLQMAKPAASKEEDLELTRKVILEHIGAEADEEPPKAEPAPEEE